MKKIIYKIKLALVVSAVFFSVKVQAQDEVGGSFAGSPEDATKLVSAYLNPLFKGFGTGLNSGWTNSAKSIGTFRFDLRISASGSFVPTKDQSYDVSKLGLTTMTPKNPNSTTGPTVFGADTEGAEMQINGITSASFKLPQGTGIHIVPAPQVQLAVGLPKNIDVMLRYVPETKISDDAGKIGLFGAGIKVEVLPLILGKANKIVPVDVALVGGYNQLNYSLPLDVNNNGAPSNQELNLKFTGYNVEAIVSKKLLFFTPFASVGYQTSTTNLSALGSYEFDVPKTISNPTGKQTFTNPITINQKDIDGMRASLGMQIKLAFFKIYGSYTVAQYSYVNAGIGLGIGK